MRLSTKTYHETCRRHAVCQMRLSMARTIVSFVAPTRGGDATARNRARGWGRARGGKLGWMKNFFASIPFPVPQKLGTDPTIANKIKGLRRFGVVRGRWCKSAIANTIPKMAYCWRDLCDFRANIPPDGIGNRNSTILVVIFPQNWKLALTGNVEKW